MSHEDTDLEEDVMSLVRLAGPRPLPAMHRAGEARAFVHAAWRAGVRRRRLRTAFLLAAAGLAAIAVAIVVRTRVAPDGSAIRASAAPMVAHLDVGRLEREGSSGWVPLEAGEALPAGTHVRTGPQGGALRVEGGRSVRVAPVSRMRWLAADRLSLESGALYVDSGRGTAGAESFEVQTPMGLVREVGTQFEVRLAPSALRVRVREGRVAVLSRGPTLDVARGTELRLDDAGPTRRAIAIHGAEWSWVLALAPAFEMEGRPLHDLLAWASHEAGWELRYADAASRRRSESAQLHGSIRGLRPDEAVATVIPSTGLSHRVRDGVLWIGPSDSE